MKSLALILILLSGCTIVVKDDRVNPDKIESQFQAQKEFNSMVAQTLEKMIKQKDK